MMRAICSGIFFLYFVFSAKGQQQNFRFDHITPSDGLSQSLTYAIYQDRQGYIWIGTQDGLNRFDGTSFKVFKSIPFDTTSLTHSWVWSIKEDVNGDLWIGTFRGLSKYDRRQDKFIQYFNDPADSTSLSGNRPNFIVSDKKGRLWISCWGQGISVYDHTSNTFHQMKHHPERKNTISGDYVRTLYCDDDGIIWAGMWSGELNKIKETANGFLAEVVTLDSSERKVTSFEEDEKGNIWIGTYEDGLIEFDKQSEKFVKHLRGESINSLQFDRKGLLWIGSLNHGLYLMHPITRDITHIPHNAHDPSSIMSNNVSSLFEDTNGIMWIGTNGIDRYDPNKSYFQNFTHKPGDDHSLGQNQVWTFCESGNKIWIGTEGGPIDLFDKMNGRFQHVPLRHPDGSSIGNVRKIVKKDNRLWVATYGSGLISYDLITKKTNLLSKDPMWPDLAAMLAIQDILLDDHILWVGSNGSGLLRMDLKTQNTRLFAYDPANPKGIGTNYINTLFNDDQGRLWIGGWGGGLSIYDETADSFTSYSYDSKNTRGLSNDIVNDIVQINDSIFWIATNEGLNKFNINTNQFTCYLEQDGLANNVVYQIQEDNRKRLWLSSNMGISCFHPLTRTIKNYTQDDGLPANEFNANASLKSDDGWMYFGGINGFTIFHPDSIRELRGFPPVVIENFKAVNDEVRLNADQSYMFDYSHNDFVITYAALEFSAPQKIRYSYTLEGFDQTWIDAGSQRSATYTNLDPGSYVFKVRSSNRDGVWNEDAVAMTIEIAPPFWKTWWFVSLCIACLLSLVYAAHTYRVNQSVKLERLRNKIASDLHDEVGSSLTRISIYSDLLQNGIHETEQKNYLKSISNISREIVSTMSDIIWSIDNRSDTVDSLIIRMKDFATETLQTRGVDFSFITRNTDEHKMLDPVVKQNLYLIFKEAINNIVKHSHATIVRAELLISDDHIEMTVQDNGSGFDIERVKKGNGLRNMDKRAKAIGASYQVTSGKGTLITLSTLHV